MKSLPTLPHRTWLERVSLGFAVALIGLGVLTLAGWWLQIDELLVPFGTPSPMRINTAMAFAILGTALLLVDLDRDRFAAVGGLATLIGGATFAQDFFGRNFGIDQLLVHDRWLDGTEHPGRMAMMLSASLILCGLVLVWRSTRWGARSRVFAEAVIGSIVASAGFSTLLGYAADLSTVYMWGSATSTPPLSAIALTLLGLALVLLAWRESTKLSGDAPSWSPMPAVVGCMTVTVTLFIGFSGQEHGYTRRTTQGVIESFAIEIRGVLERQTFQVDRLVREWESYPTLPSAATRRENPRWDADALEFFTQQDATETGCLSLAFLDLTIRNAWWYPHDKNEGAINFDHGAANAPGGAAPRAAGTPPQKGPRRLAIDAADRRPAFSTTIPVHVPGKGTLDRGFVLYTPFNQVGQLVGYVAAEYSYPILFRHVAGKMKQIEGYNVIVSIANDRVFSLTPDDSSLDTPLTVEKQFTIADRRIRISLTPTSVLLARDRRYLPELALAAGLGITVLLGLSVHLARSARSGQRAAELSNKKLFAENEERRRVEARLKVSDERLRLALDSTQIGIFEWSVAAGHVYYSPGLWAMLGYEHGRMPSTVEAWQSLIHPDDLPLYRRRTESQLNGIASFIEPEYRVRARSGDWRWVYTRSK
ncbi:MAG: PAS domain-containing protein, partial [Verrucomicrobiota bacterium]